MQQLQTNRGCMLAAHVQHARRRRISPDGLRMRTKPISRLSGMLFIKTVQHVAAC